MDSIRTDARNKIGFWESIKQSLGVHPQNVDGQWNLRTEYYWWILLNIAKGLFKIECPDYWDKDYMLDTMLIDGYFIVTDTYYGVLPLKGGLHGVDVFNRPNRAVISNHDPHIQNLQREIGIDCVVVSINGSGFRRGIVPILNIYAEKLASCDAAIEINLLNSKTAHVFGARNKREAESLKAMYDEIALGKPAVFVQGDVAELAEIGFYKADVKNNFVSDLVQIEKRKIIEEFLTLMGINNANTDKRERLNSDEVNSNNMELLINTDYWNKNLTMYCEDVNKMFPDVNLSITMPYREIEEDRMRMLLEQPSSEAEQKGDNNETDAT